MTAPTPTAVKVTGYADGTPFDLWVEPVDDRHYLRSPDVAGAFRAMRTAARAAGFRFDISTAWRDNDWQQKLYDKWVAYQKALDDGDPDPIPAAKAAKPGYSNHQNGTAVDINRAEVTNAAGDTLDSWLAAHAADYGFHRELASEPWHWRWVG